MNPLYRAAVRKLLRSEGVGTSRFALAFWLVLAVAFAAAARASAGATSVLAFGALMLPMLVFTVVGRTVGVKGLTLRTQALSAMGASRVQAAVSHLVVAAIASALVAGVSAVVFLALAHTAKDPALGKDLLATFVAATVCGATYATYFALGSTFRSGLGRSLFLGLDWILGGTAGLELVFPRAHLRSLLGGTNVASLRPSTSLVTLVVLAILFGVLSILRARDPRK